MGLPVSKYKSASGCEFGLISTMVILFMFMSTGQDYLSELRPAGGLLFIPQTIGV
jgi:hypothetical protein